jgi:hypothetical protein
VRPATAPTTASELDEIKHWGMSSFQKTEMPQSQLQSNLFLHKILCLHNLAAQDTELSIK